MTNEEAIDNFIYCQAMMLFDPLTGETDTLESMNKDNQDLYNALSVGIEVLSAENIQNWTSVETELPKEKGEYLVAYHPCHWDYVKEETLVGTDTFRGKTTWAKYKHQRNTHWMPIPKTPK